MKIKQLKINKVIQTPLNAGMLSIESTKNGGGGYENLSQGMKLRLIPR